ncbi:mycofactocin system glycosyltransferase [Rubrobacter marinus]|uniref:Mycofactocin system glycosyltransferase n=1 Tax=Rubrobacter marinus TaxID=2653852 RepID=A0A6G8Q206_9ACTN|nr:mycofactocin biosynthesis glycosyltransferase MftF [Rubrobacter marinus]QIN80488.1 mycofactocin system glycosyltransferase [Rubrobacter marinus]
MLEPRTDLRASLVGELAEYLDGPEEEVLQRCRAGAGELAEAWRTAAPNTTEEVTAFYRGTDAYLYDLTWWHALVEDESALAGVEALEAAAGHRARTVLDFGSGIGSLGLLMARHGLDVTLAEINPALSDYARWRFDRRVLSARFLDAGTEALPEAAFDFVSAVDVLEHLPDPRAALRSLAAALRPGGTLFVHLPPEADASRPMHLWHGTGALLAHLDEAGLWLEGASGSSLVLRRGPAPRYGLERGLEVRPTKGGWLLFSERPLMATRLNPQAAGLLARLDEERSAAGLAEEAGLPLTDAAAFLDGLADRRLVRRTSQALPARWPSVTVVVPSRDRPTETRACAESLLALDYPADGLEVLVVDDASEPPLSEALGDLPLRVLRLDENVGQSAARNLAMEAARGEVVAFIDNDCLAHAGWLRALVPPLCEPGVDVAGGRVLSPPPDGRIAAFEAVRSSLDMGPVGGKVGAQEPVAYLPSCNLAADREALRSLGGFDKEMLLGEDADLVWRAARAGSGIRYEPSAEIVHRHRTRLLPFLRRRADYGSSEADLQRRHPEARRTMMVPVLGGLLLAAPPVLPLSWPASLALVVLAALLACVEVGLKTRRLRRVGARLPTGKIVAAVARQHGAGLYHLGTNVVRYYSLPLLGASLLWPALLPPVLALMVIPPVVDHGRLRPKMSLASFACLYWAELAAYQIGVWRGCLERRTIRPLVPKLRIGR